MYFQIESKNCDGKNQSRIWKENNWLELFSLQLKWHKVKEVLDNLERLFGILKLGIKTWRSYHFAYKYFLVRFK